MGNQEGLLETMPFEWGVKGKKQSTVWKSGGNSVSNTEALSENETGRRMRPGYLACNDQPERGVE